jgi:hypothetical protein
VGALAPVIDNGGCTNCHNAGSMLGIHKLDLSGTIDAAHAALFDQPARGSECGTSGLKLIAPNDCANSLLYQKLATMPPTPIGPFEDPGSMTEDTLCGDIMPPTRLAFPADLLDCLCQWIDAGAPLDWGVR